MATLMAMDRSCLAGRPEMVGAHPGEGRECAVGSADTSRHRRAGVALAWARAAAKVLARPPPTPEATMVHDGEPTAKRLGAAEREDLGDARLLLETAAHNVAAALRVSDPEEARAAIATALAMAGQAQTTLQRVAGSCG
jgi:hypothetical protein